MDFVSFSLNYWDDLWQSRHQITQALAKEHKVLFVSPPFTLAQVLKRRKEEPLPESGLIHRGANLHTVVFPQYLFQTFRFPRIEKLTSELRQSKIRNIMKEFG